jgi:hypothetical protein
LRLTAKTQVESETSLPGCDTFEAVSQPFWQVRVYLPA